MNSFLTRFNGFWIAAVEFIRRRLARRSLYDTNAVYFNALTGKTSYALVRQGQRVAGYDNYRFWHYHPPGEVDIHQPCDEPTPEEAIVSLIEGLSR